MISKTQIDRLGDRLKKGVVTETDLRMLDQYRRSFAEAYDFVVGRIRGELQLEPTGRTAKSRTSVEEKLLRESIRLTQIQDIAGCRLIVADIKTQEQAIKSLTGLFENATVVDRRIQPSHGYRAVHVIVKYNDKLVEIQVRTLLQHRWAELSEKLSDVLDPGIKYGKGDQTMVDALLKFSSNIAWEESQEVTLAALEIRVSDKLSKGSIGRAQQEELVGLQKELREAQTDQASLREQTLTDLQGIIEQVLGRRE